MVVRELLTKLGFSVNGAQFNKAEQATQRIKNQANEAANAVRGMVAGFIGLQGIQSLIATGDQVQSLQARIGMLPQTIAPAGEAFNYVADAAIDARSSLLAYGTLYTRIGHAAKDYLKTSEEVAGVTTTISKALVVGGATTQEAQSTMIQFAQALGSGTLQGEEFRAMAEAAPQYMDKLAEALGHPRAALKKLASEGKITSKDVIEATKKMKDYFDQQMMKMPMTVGQATTIIGSRWAKMVNRLNNESSFITRIANTIIGAMDSIESGVESLEKKFGGFNNILRSLGFLLGAALGAKAISMLIALGSVAASTILPFLLIGGAILATAALLDDLYVWINGGESVIGDLIGSWKEWESTVMPIINGVKTAFVWLGKYIAASAAVLVGIFTLDAGLIRAVLEDIASLFKAVISTIWGWFVAAFMHAVDSVKNVFVQALIDLGMMIYNAVFNPIVNAVSNAWAKAKEVFSGALDIAGKVIPGLSPSIQTPSTGVSLGSLSPSAIGQGRNIQNNTAVTVTVPPGTTAEQASFLQAAAAKTFGDASDAKFARQISVYAP